MKINFCVETSAGFTEGSAELSYLGLLTQMKEDLSSDECMPEADHKKANKLLDELYNVLYKYSY